jgi:trans-feruloyl-CoA hydratase/vanillin synthase
MVTYAVPAKRLQKATIDLAERLMKKSPAVLRATKQAIRHVRTMDVAQSYEYLAVKGQAIKVGDKEDSYSTGMNQFLNDKSYKPTYEPFRLKSSAVKKRSGGK